MPFRALKSDLPDHGWAGATECPIQFPSLCAPARAAGPWELRSYCSASLPRAPMYTDRAEIFLGRAALGRVGLVRQLGHLYRYYRLSGPPVAELLEALAGMGPAQPIRFLRQSRPK